MAGSDGGGRAEAIRVVVTRGPLVESEHAVAVFAVDAAGRTLLACGDPGRETSLRSATKPYQAAPAVAAGVLERFGWGDRELALACASHGGEPEHVALAGRMLASLGLGTDDLECGVHAPAHGPSAASLRAAGAAPSALHNNCSGKHAGMLAFARLLDAPTRGYVAPDHPVQRAIRAGLEARVGRALASGGDGCGVPCFAVRLDEAAALYRDLALGAEPVLDRIFGAMAAHPRLVSGTDRFDAALAEAFAGTLVAKGGAEAAFGVAARPVGAAPFGLFAKVRDGGERALPPAILHALDRLGVLDGAQRGALARYARVPRLDHAGRVVGEIRVA